MALPNQKPIFLATHPRSVSTAFERVFMNRDDLACEHEPFGDAHYYGPERLAPRFDGDENKQLREETGFQNLTFADILGRIQEDGEEGKRIFIKDMAQYLMPPAEHKDFNNAKIVPSVSSMVNEDAEKNLKTKNPTVLPVSILDQFHFAFLIRNPRRAAPSYYRCSIPPHNKTTKWFYFKPNEAGFKELRDLVEFLLAEGKVYDPRNEKTAADHHGTSHVNGQVRNGGGTTTAPYKLTVIDADDLLDYPADVVRQFCEDVGLNYNDQMLEWGVDKGCESFDKWKGWHDDAIGSSALKPRVTQKKPKTREQEIAEWTEKYGAEAAKVIDQTGEENMEHYEYLKQFKMNVGPIANGNTNGVTNGIKEKIASAVDGVANGIKV